MDPSAEKKAKARERQRERKEKKRQEKEAELKSKVLLLTNPKQKDRANKIATRLATYISFGYVAYTGESLPDASYVKNFLYYTALKQTSESNMEDEVKDVLFNNPSYLEEKLGGMDALELVGMGKLHARRLKHTESDMYYPAPMSTSKLAQFLEKNEIVEDDKELVEELMVAGDNEESSESDSDMDDWKQKSKMDDGGNM